MPITTQQHITPGGYNRGQEYNDNVDRANSNDEFLAAELGDLRAQPAVRSVNGQGPDEAGALVLPPVLGESMTTAQRDALTGADLVLGRTIYNTTFGKSQVYGNTGWEGTSRVTRQVFTASGTWTKPLGASRVRIICISAGQNGSAGSGGNDGLGNFEHVGGIGGRGGGRAETTLDADDVPQTCTVTVGANGGSTSVGGVLLATATGPFATTVATPSAGGVPGSSSASAEGAGGGGTRIRGPQGEALHGPAGASGSLSAGGRGAAGGSRSGTGLCGSGGGWGNSGGPGGAGGVPGGGGGGGGTTTSSSNTAGGPGGRGEVVIDVYY